MAYVITSKLGDHLPLYRLENIFARQQVHVARSTMCAWMRAAGELVAPLVELMAARVRQSRVIHTDDTTVPIQSPGPEAVPQGAHLVLPGRRGQSVHRLRLHAEPHAAMARPSWLAGYRGLLASGRLRRLRRHLPCAEA